MVTSAERLEELRRTLKMTAADDRMQSVLLIKPVLVDGRSIVSSSAITAVQVVDQSQQAVIIEILDSFAMGSQLCLDTTHIYSLAKRLSCVDNPLTSGLLRCRGLLELQTNEDEILKCAFVFEIPEHLDRPRSLRDLLTTMSSPSMNEKLCLAKTLARSIMFVHNFDFVHKGVRPENILRFDQGQGLPMAAFLVGFESFRFAEGATSLSQKLEWQKDIYRHPSRQGSRPQLRYVMQHDIYSLGVCLLEIGLWRSFVVSYPSNGDVTYAPGPDLPIAHLLGMTDQTRKGWQIKDMLVQLAQGKLPALMGQIYTSIVLTCLNSWESNAEESLFGTKDEFHNEDGILEGVRYSEKVLLELEKIVV